MFIAAEDADDFAVRQLIMSPLSARISQEGEYILSDDSESSRGIHLSVQRLRGRALVGGLQSRRDPGEGHRHCWEGDRPIQTDHE